MTPRDPIVIVGSGASGVHFAQSALERGRKVLMLDVGNARLPAPFPEDDLDTLKRRLPEPARWFLGDEFESLILPGADGEYYGFPPSKNYVFKEHDAFRWRATGFEPLVSFATGGLAEAWTGGSYPFTAAETAAFPFDYRELLEAYSIVARRIGISGAEDDMARFFPLHDGLMEPVALDDHALRLLDAYDSHRGEFNDKHRFYLGRARLAVLSKAKDGRRACDRLGRCLWGCPSDSLWTPGVAFRALREHPNFDAVTGIFVDHFQADAGGRVIAVHAKDAAGAARTFEVGTLVLAAGTLASARIFLASLRADLGKAPPLYGLIDNRQMLMPFVNLKLLGQSFEPRSYQYHQLAMGYDAGGPMDYVHGLVTTLKTALVHPVIQNLPFDLRTSTAFFRGMHKALGLVNINFSDERRLANTVALERGPDGADRLVVEYRPAAGEKARLARTAAHFRKMLAKLGCLAPAAMTHVRPMGASVHYAGLLPMAREGSLLTTDPAGQSRAYENLFVVDGSTFPALPAKNLTFTLMANAVRIATRIFGS